MNEDLTLLVRAVEGDKEARELFLEKNRGLVVHIAKRFSETENEDLIQAGFVGMIKALDNFNLEYQNAFSTYAVPLIMGEIREWLRKEMQVNIGRRGRELYLRAKEVSDRLYKDEGVEPSLARVAKILAVDKEELVYALEAARTPKSFDEAIDDENKISFGDLLAAKDDDNDQKILVNHMLASLDERSRYIVTQRFFREKTQIELAAELQVSQAQICRIEKKALKKLRDILGDD